VRYIVAPPTPRRPERGFAETGGDPSLRQGTSPPAPPRSGEGCLSPRSPATSRPPSGLEATAAKRSSSPSPLRGGGGERGQPPLREGRQDRTENDAVYPMAIYPPVIASRCQRARWG